jgi:hypothetical protein
MSISVDFGAIWEAGSEAKSVKSMKNTDAELGGVLGPKPKTGVPHFLAARRNAEAAGEDFRRGTRFRSGTRTWQGLWGRRQELAELERTDRT